MDSHAVVSIFSEACGANAAPYADGAALGAPEAASLFQLGAAEPNPARSESQAGGGGGGCRARLFQFDGAEPRAFDESKAALPRSFGIFDAGSRNVAPLLRNLVPA